MSQAASTTDVPVVAAASSEAGAPPTKTAKVKGSKRPKAIKRRGARDDEGEEDSSRPAVPDDGDSDSDSDFSAQHDDDDDEDEDASDAESATATVVAPAPVVAVETEAAAPSPAVEAPGAGTESPAPLIGQPGHPSWADVPAGGDSELPTLDFAALTPTTLAQVPAHASRAATPLATADGTAPLSKKAQMLAKREAKSAALKAKDPVAFEQMEVDRKAREQAKKREKKERKRLERTAGTQSHDPAAPAVEVLAPGEPDTSRTAPPLARPARGPVPSRPSRTAQSGLLDLSHPSTSNAPGSGSGPNSAPQFQRGERRGPPSGGPYPPPEYVNAREAYAARLAADPSYTPRVGRFWSHDDRLAPQELRPLTNNWRGRGGRGRGGGDGMRGGRGGSRGGREGGGPPQGYNPGWDTSAGAGEGGAPDAVATGHGWAQSTNHAEHAPTPPPAKAADTDPEDDDEDDGWGRGEAKRKLRPSFPAGAPAAIPAWSHDGFDELKQSESNRPARGAGGAGRGRGGRAHGAPGSINPAYANLPFHPQHRFPMPPPEETTMTSLPTAEQDLFEPSTGPQSIVRLPGSGAVDASLAHQTAALTLDHDPRGVVVNMGGRGGQQPVTVFPRSVEELEAEHEERRRGGASILYAADPERLARIPQDPLVGQYPHPHAPPMQHYQLPPHLQAQAQAQHQAQFIPRHASPAYYPQPYYSPDAFPSMPTPGTTPPPLFPGAQAANFFVPPRHSKIEIKAPGPSHSPSLHKSNLSATGGAFQPGAPAHVAASFHQQQGSPASSPSPQLFADPNMGYYAHPEQGYYEHDGQYAYDQQAYWNEQNYAQQQQNYSTTTYYNQGPQYQGQGF